MKRSQISNVINSIMISVRNFTVRDFIIKLLGLRDIECLGISYRARNRVDCFRNCGNRMVKW